MFCSKKPHLGGEKACKRHRGDGHPRAKRLFRGSALSRSLHRCHHLLEDLPEGRFLRGGKVDAHKRAGFALGMEQRAGGQQVALVQHALGQGISVHARIDPAEQAHRLCRKSAAGLQRQLDAA